MNVPRLTVVVAFHDMQREAPRTLHTLSPAYQQGVAAEAYEVIAVDVGSRPPLDEGLVLGQGPNFRLLRFPRAPSPVAAINAAVRQARAAAVMVCIDGARMLTPGVVRFAAAALAGFPDRLVATVSWHLGPKVQNESMLEGYDRAVEDRLLESIDWRHDGYRLFEIGCLARSSGSGWLGPIEETNCFAMRREIWERLGGYDERFVSPGGGLVNPDFFQRACDLLGPPLVLLGEGTFHQFHGGVATNAPRASRPVLPMAEEYESIRGRPYAHLADAVPPPPRPTLLGGLPAAGLPWLAGSLERAGAADSQPGHAAPEAGRGGPPAGGRSGPAITPETPFVLIHVGKCGGSSAVAELSGRGYRFEHVHLRRPQAAPGRRYVVLVRDPVARFVSAFNYRRQLFAVGRLAADSGDDPVAALRHAMERDVLTRFADVNDFAERLGPGGRYDVSPLATLMHLIGHVPHGFAWHLDGLLRGIEPGQLAGVIATERFAEDFDRVFGFLPESRRNAADGGAAVALSEQGRENLARVLAAEYETLAVLAELAGRAGVPISLECRRR